MFPRGVGEEREGSTTEAKATFDRCALVRGGAFKRGRTCRAAGDAHGGGGREGGENLRLDEKVLEVTALRTTWRFPRRLQPDTEAALDTRGVSRVWAGPRPCAFVRWPQVTLELCATGQVLRSSLQQRRTGPASRVEKAGLGPDRRLWIQAP